MTNMIAIARVETCLGKLRLICLFESKRPSVKRWLQITTAIEQQAIAATTTTTTQQGRDIYSVSIFNFVTDIQLSFVQ